MTTEPNQRGRIKGTAKHTRRFPKTPTKRGTKFGRTERKPSLLHKRVAQQMDVRCYCGRTGPLNDVRWWPLISRWIGECECGNSPAFTVPLAEAMDR